MAWTGSQLRLVVLLRALPLVFVGRGGAQAWTHVGKQTAANSNKASIAIRGDDAILVLVVVVNAIAHWLYCGFG